MIYKLRRKFIKICILSFIAVFIVLFLSILLVTTVQTNRSLDMLADVVSSNNGTFPQSAAYAQRTKYGISFYHPFFHGAL